MSGLSESEKKIIFDGLEKINEIDNRLVTIETILTQRKNNIRYTITTWIAIIAVCWSIIQPFILRL